MLRKLTCLFLIGALMLPNFTLYSQNEKEYIIGPRDDLVIRVVANTEMDKQIKVAPDGFILFPPIQEAIKASGLTTRELSLKLAKSLKKYITGAYPEILVNVSSYNSRQVSVLGLVQQPGVYGFITIPNLIEVLMRAGGPLPQAELKEVKILRGDKAHPKFINIDVTKFLKEGDFSLLPGLQPGDTVFVPAQIHVASDAVTPSLEEPVDDDKPQKRTLHILGQVYKPGNFILPETEESLYLVEALLVAGGGATPLADLDRVRIIRGTRKQKEDGYQVETINFNDYLAQGSLAGNPQVHPGDTLFVPQVNIDGPLLMSRRPLNKVVYVTGQVLRPGGYVIEDDNNIWKAVALAGGPTTESKLQSSYLIRQTNDKKKNVRVAVDLKRIIKGKDPSPVLKDGDTILIGKKMHFWRGLVGVVRDLASVAIAYGTISIAAEQAKNNK